MRKVIALVGLSGVGKTSALNALSNHRSFQHLGASQLIREGRQLEDKPEALESLRNSNISQNQRLLTAGFRRVIDSQATHIVLDGHTVIETPSGLIAIDPEVFQELGITKFIFLSATPVVIASRRKADATRNRPIPPLDQIRIYQEAALLAAFNICVKLEIPLSIILPNEINSLEHLIFDEAN